MSFKAFLIVFCTGFGVLAFSSSTLAADCTCQGSISGPLCTTRGSTGISYNSPQTAGNIISALPRQNCNINFEAFLNREESFTIHDAAECNSVHYSGSQLGHTYVVSCSAERSDGGNNKNNTSLSSNDSYFSSGGSIKKEKGTTYLVNPIGGQIQGNHNLGQPNITIIVGSAIKYALGIVGSIAFAAFVYGGFLWLTSAGHADKVSTGTNTMLYATIGLFIIFSAYAILNTIISGIAK